MSRPGIKRHLINMLIGGMILLYPCPLLFAAEESEENGQPQTLEEEISPPLEMLLGKIDRVGDNELVIDDSLYTISAEGGLKAGSFHEGQTVSGELDDNGRIISLQILRRAAPKAGTARQEIPDNGFTRSSTTGQTLYQKDGVWKN